MLWDGGEVLLGLPGVAEAHRLDEVRVLDVAVRTGDHVAVVAVEVQALHRVQQELVAGVALGRGRGRLLLVLCNTGQLRAIRKLFYCLRGRNKKQTTGLASFMDIDSVVGWLLSYLCTTGGRLQPS